MQENFSTKKLLGQALIILSQKKNFSKITISDITQVSGYNRQTFYYHFRDKYELLVWIYEQDAFRIFDQQLSFDNWHIYMQRLLEMILQNKEFYINTIHTNEGYFGDFIFRVTEKFFCHAINTLDVEGKLHEEDKQFYAQFFSFGIRGVLINWIKKNMKEDPVRLSMNLKRLANDSIQLGYERYNETLGGHEGGKPNETTSRTL